MTGAGRLRDPGSQVFRSSIIDSSLVVVFQFLIVTLG
jgi:hypothetical protein